MPAPTGERVHSGWCPRSVARPAVSSLKMLRLSLKQMIIQRVAPHWWEKETDHLIETNNHHLLNFRPIIHANVPGERPFVEFFPFVTKFCCVVVFADWLCVWLCLLTPPPLLLDCVLMNYILLHNFTFIYLSVCLPARLFICTGGRRGARAELISSSKWNSW